MESVGAADAGGVGGGGDARLVAGELPDTEPSEPSEEPEEPEEPEETEENEDEARSVASAPRSVSVASPARARILLPTLPRRVAKSASCRGTFFKHHLGAGRARASAARNARAGGPRASGFATSRVGLLFLLPVSV